LKKYGLGEDELGKGIFVLSAEEVESLGLDDHESELIQPWFKGSDVGPFRAKQEPKQFVIYAKKKHGGLETRASLKNHLDRYRQIIDTSSTNSPYLHCPRNGDFMGPKIVMPYRTPRSRFAYVEGPWFASVDVTFLTASRGLELDLKTLTGILNSPIVFCWLYFRGKRKGAQLELYPKPLSALPLPPINDHTRPLFLRIRSLVESVLELDSDENPHQFEEGWSEINSLVSELYGLGEQEQRIVLEWRESLPDA
jgi:adenine-specific DNA-methyltransferase